MGRPLRKDKTGVDVIGTPATTSTGIRIEAYFGGAAYTDATYNGPDTGGADNYAYLVKQRGAKTFVVANQAGTKATCVLQAAIPDSNNEMRINGYIGGNGSTPTPIAKITKRVATDFNGKRYTWQIVNDSTSDYIALTAA